MSDQADRIYERLLVVRAQAGDAAAFAELVERFSPRLRYFLRKLVDGDGAEDALQDVWLDVVRQLPRLKDPQALVAWLYRIARDRAYGRLRKSRRAEQPLDEASVVDSAAAKRANSRRRTPRGFTRRSTSCRRSSARCSCCGFWKR